ncbi:MAG: Gmad2 immunoglobulin-like domain-containing protein [Patescibacteria group bacterium]
MRIVKIIFPILGTLIIVGLIIAGAIYLSNNESVDNDGDKNRNGERNGEGINIDTSDWETYRNEEYGFSLRYPSGWKIHEETDHPVSVMFNFYKPSEEIGDPPYDHHSSDVTHVSVFPEGIPKEGIFGESVASGVDFKEEVVEPKDYVLAGDTPFATKADLSSPPAEWNESAFIFANTPISNLEVKCKNNGEVTSKEECDVMMGDTPVRYGNINEIDRAVEVAILESFEFIETDNGEDDLIRTLQPEEGDIVSSPIKVSGEARGNWYFEATFPVRVEDANGTVLGEHYAETEDDWMTEDFVNFESEFSFEEPETATGTLILEKANPSGLEENADERRITIRFNE